MSIFFDSVIGKLTAQLQQYESPLAISREDVGQIMHESWTKTKRNRGYHHPSEKGHDPLCIYCHEDLVPWEQLPEPQKDINRHAFDDVLPEMQRRAGLPVCRLGEFN